MKKVLLTFLMLLFLSPVANAADQKTTALTPVTPILTDELYIVDDPGGTPVSGSVTLTALQTLIGGLGASSTTEVLFNNAAAVDGMSTFKFTDATKTITNTGTFKSSTPILIGDGTNQSYTLLQAWIADSNPLLSWDQTNTEIDLTHTLHITGTLQATGIEVDTGTIYIQEQADADSDIATYGQWWVDTATPNVPMFTNDAGTDFVLGLQKSATHHFSFALENPANADNFFLLKAPYAMTIVSITGILDPTDTGENLNVNIRECDGTGDSCATITGTMNVDNDGTTDASHSNATIDSGDWIDVYMNTIGATLPANLSATVTYTID